MSHPCEKCGAAHAEPFHTFELESWNIPMKTDEEYHYLCFDCFDALTENPLQTDEVKQRMKHNREELDKVIREGLVCPKCKNIILEENHVCEEH